MALFSKRHKRALASSELRVEFEQTLRVRIWRLMERHNRKYKVPGRPYRTYLEDLEKDLLDAYGDNAFYASEPKWDGTYASLSFVLWIQRGPASGLLDAVEGYKRRIPSETWVSFRSELNEILKEEESTWRLMDSEFVLLDSAFVHENIVARSQAVLHSVKFLGAEQEMANAQNALVDGDGRAVVHNAGKAFESVMKAALDKDHLSAQQLTDALLEEGFFDDLPEDQRGGFAKQVVGALPWLRNRLGGHGQGREAQPVSEPYARLAFGLAAVFNEFIATLARERDSSLAQEQVPPVPKTLIAEQAVPVSSGAGDDDIPF
jgi:hypothetical protein